MKNKNTLVPQLRFTNNGQQYPSWETIKLSKVAKRVTVKNKKDSINRVLTNSATFGIIDQQNYFDKHIANENNI